MWGSTLWRTFFFISPLPADGDWGLAAVFNWATHCATTSTATAAISWTSPIGTSHKTSVLGSFLRFSLGILVQNSTQSTVTIQDHYTIALPNSLRKNSQGFFSDYFMEAIITCDIIKMYANNSDNTDSLRCILSLTAQILWLWVRMLFRTWMPAFSEYVTLCMRQSLTMDQSSINESYQTFKIFTIPEVSSELQQAKGQNP